MPAPTAGWEGLPEWLTELLQEYITYRQRRWKPSQVRNHTCARLNTLRRVWRWLLDEEQVSGIADLQRAHVQSFIEARLAADIRGDCQIQWFGGGSGACPEPVEGIPRERL